MIIKNWKIKHLQDYDIIKFHKGKLCLVNLLELLEYVNKIVDEEPLDII